MMHIENPLSVTEATPKVIDALLAFFKTEEAVEAFNDNVVRFLKMSEHDEHESKQHLIARINERGAADAIAWVAEGAISAEYEAAVAKRIADVVKKEGVSGGSLPMAALLVLHHEYERFLTESRSLANSTGHGHRFSDMAIHSARANFFQHTVGFRMGLGMKMHNLMVFVEDYYESLK